MTIANKKVSYAKSLEINVDGSSESHTVLKDVFLKKAEDYVCQVARFMVNSLPPINIIDEPLLYIRTRGDANDTVQTVANVGNVGIFQPPKVHSWVELTRRFVEFCTKFNAFLDEEYIKFVLTNTGQFELRLHPEFLTQFYLEWGSEAQKYTGFDRFMFVVHNGLRSFSHEDGINHLLVVPSLEIYEAQLAANILINFNVNNLEHVQESQTFVSKRALNAFDHRLSLDVWATFPIKNTVSFLDGVETHEFILSRFPISDYNQVHSKVIVQNNKLSPAKILEENLAVGLLDLCKNNPESIMA
jgi:hypothetical protein